MVAGARGSWEVRISLGILIGELRQRRQAVAMSYYGTQSLQARGEILDVLSYGADPPGRLLGATAASDDASPWENWAGTARWEGWTYHGEAP